MTRHVIIGDGGAGTTAAYFIRQGDPSAQIEIYSDDPNAAYYRASLTNYLMGELREAQLFAVPPDFYQTERVRRTLGRVTGVDAKNARLTLADGSQVPYDQLLIAAGARPNPPGFPGAGLAGVMTLRTLQDARAVMEMASSGRLRQAVIAGGGPLGIEWVQGLLHHQVKVTYLLREETFFQRALDRTASDLVISRLRAEGVDVYTGEEIGEAVGGNDGRLRAARLKHSGEEIECQLLGAAIGIRPNVDFLDGSGIEVAQGVKVDEHMRTNIPNVYAAGDVIQDTLGLWEPARLQGRVAGRNMAGGSESYRPGAYYNATRLYDLDFAGVGEVTEQPGDRVLVDFPKGSGRVAYRKLIIRDEKLVGAMMLGQRKENVRKHGLRYRKLIDGGIDLSSVSKNLLDPAFDLASWMDSRQMTDQIDTARRIVAQPSIASIADIRKTHHTLKTVLADLPRMPHAVLQRDGVNIPLKGLMEIGRHPKNNLTLDDPEVSGKHARIRWDGSAFVLKDLGSRNGTFLDGVKLKAPSALLDGALIRVGGTQLRFQLVAAPETRPPVSGSLPKAVKAPDGLTWGTLQVGERQIALRAASLNIGRSAQAEVVVDDPTVSSIHAQIVRQGADAYLRDLGSRNGTYVNDEPVSVPHALQNGDEIQLGKVALVFHLGPPDADRQDPLRATAPSPSPEAPAQADAPLVALSMIARAGPLLGLSFVLDKSPVSIGRHPKNDIILNDQTVGRYHALFKNEGGTWFVEDLGSSNRVSLNNKRLDPNRPYRLKPSDRLRLGDTLLEVTQHAG